MGNGNMTDYYLCFHCDEKWDTHEVDRSNDNFEPMCPECLEPCRPMTRSEYDDPGYNAWDEDER